MRNEINFIDPEISSEDKLLFFGQDEDQDGPTINIQSGWSMAHVMQEAGLFPSVKQAKKNGWDKAIPVGFDYFVVGKKKLDIFILTKFD